MPRELETYRDNIEQLNRKFEFDMLTRNQLEEFTGLSRKTVIKEFPYVGKYISKANFARMLARKGEPE